MSDRPYTEAQDLQTISALQRQVASLTQERDALLERQRVIASEVQFIVNSESFIHWHDLNGDTYDAVNRIVAALPKPEEP